MVRVGSEIKDFEIVNIAIRFLRNSKIVNHTTTVSLNTGIFPLKVTEGPTIHDCELIVSY